MYTGVSLKADFFLLCKYIESAEDVLSVRFSITRVNAGVPSP